MTVRDGETEKWYSTLMVRLSGVAIHPARENYGLQGMAKKSGAGATGLALKVEAGACEQFGRAVVNSGPPHKMTPSPSLSDRLEVLKNDIADLNAKLERRPFYQSHVPD